MPNRIIKESICTSEEIDALTPEAEVLFYRLMVKADDFGLFFASPDVVASMCFPHKRKLAASTVAKWMNELQSAGLIMIYTADDGKKYLKLLSWEKHQRKRATESKYPLPPTNDGACGQAHADVSGCQQVTAYNVNVFENVNVNENVFENDDSTEPEASAPQPEPTIISLPLNDKTEYPITQSQVDEWKGLYPAVDVPQELRNMKGWLNANTTRRKTKSGILRFVTGWLAKEQNRGRTKGGGRDGPGNGGKDSGGDGEIPDLPRMLKV